MCTLRNVKFSSQKIWWSTGTKIQLSSIIHQILLDEIYHSSTFEEANYQSHLMGGGARPPGKLGGHPPPGKIRYTRKESRPLLVL